MHIDGGCHCGSIRYEAEVDPEKTIICHCSDCQALSGSAYRTVIFVPAECFNLVAGDLKTYIKIADSGNRRAMLFCPDCGTQIYATSADGDANVLGLRVGTARQRAELRPRKQHWCRSALDWTEDLSEVERVE